MTTATRISSLLSRIIPQGLLFFSFLAMTSHGRAADWPRFLGPKGDGTSPETGLLRSWPDNGPPIRWMKSVGTGYSAPSVRGNKVVLHHRLGGEEIVECFSSEDGTSLWRHSYPSDFQDPYGYNNGPRASPFLTQDRCFAFGAEGRLVCLDMANGRRIWERLVQEDWKIPEAFFGIGSSPILYENKLIVMIGGQPNSGMAAFDPATGEVLWESVGRSNWEGRPKLGWPGTPPVKWDTGAKQASYASPVVASFGGKDRALCFMRQGLVLLDPATGHVDDSFWFRARQEESVNAMSPVVVDNQVFISSAYYRSGAVLLEVDEQNLTFEQRWRSQVLEIHWSTPIYHDGYLYAFSGRNEPDARFRCIEFESGKLMWDRDESWNRWRQKPPSTFGRGSLIKVDGKLIVLGEAGLLALYGLNPRQPEEICRFQVPRLEYPCWAGPVLSHGHLYLRDESTLICLDLRK